MIEETSLQTVDKLVTFLETKIEVDDDLKQMFADFKTQLLEELKEEAKAAAKGGKSKRGKGGASDGEPEKKKRAPSAYNLFIKEKMAAIKAEKPELKSKELMAEAIQMWKAQKGGEGTGEESEAEKPKEVKAETKAKGKK